METPTLCRHGIRQSICQECIAKPQGQMPAGSSHEPGVPQEMAPHAVAPAYYASDRSDLYALLIAQFGRAAWQRHVEMEVIQYVVRASKKGSYEADIRKARTCLERLLVECCTKETHVTEKGM